MTLSNLHLSLVSLASCWRLHSAFSSFGERLSANDWFWSPLVSCHVSPFHSTTRQLPLSSVLWRVLLLGIGILYGTGNFIADRHYTTGANDLRLGELVTAARMFPFSHEYRLGPARLVIRDNEWYRPEQALPLLRASLRGDPYSKWLEDWIAVFEARQHELAGASVTPTP